MMELVLMYHDVYVHAPEESGLASYLYKIRKDEFERQIIALKEAETKANCKIIFTFDDGGSSFYEPISFILDKYNIKGYFFIATKYIGKKGFLNCEQIRDLDRRGHIIGSHSHSHPDNLSSLSEDEIAEEWLRSITILENILGHQVDVASIPNGYQSKKVIEKARSAKISTLFTSKPTCKIQKYYNMSIIGRYVILNDMISDDVSNYIMNKRKRKVLLVKWQLLNVVKFILGDNYESVKQKIFG